MLFLVSLILSLLGVAGFIRLAGRFGWGKSVRKDGPKSHLFKDGTPTMGGCAFLLAALVAWLIFGTHSPDTWMLLVLGLGSALLGWADDMTSIKRKRAASEGVEADIDEATGVLARYRIAVQTIVALIFAIYAVMSGHDLFGPNILDALLFTFVIVGSINAVNFTDGLDGLAGGVSVILLLPFIGQPFVACLIAALLGFLWFNAKPAKVFMGGVGSESLGALIAGVVILQGWTWWYPLMAVVPVAEVLSVITQVGYFKMTGGKRIFKMAPIHHHFELSGWSEEKVVVRFWLVTAICVGLAWQFRRILL